MISATKRGSVFFKNAIEFLKKNTDLIKLPIITLVIAIAFAIAEFFVAAEYITKHQTSAVIAILVSILILAAIITFVGIYINSIFYMCVTERLQGKTCSINEGFQKVKPLTGKIIGWTLLSICVSAILNLLENLGWIGDILMAILGTAWSVLSYFVMPIMIVNNIGPIDAIKQSASLFKNKWRRNFRLGGYYFLIITAIMVTLFAIGSSFKSMTAYVILGILFVCYMIFARIMSVIISSALYLYTGKNITPEGFAPEYLDNALAEKRKRRFL